jgi:lipoprotein-anchoring transpeptidase ErfK/SrfK
VAVLGLVGAAGTAVPALAGRPAATTRPGAASRPAAAAHHAVHLIPAAHAIPASVRIAGVRVGGLTPGAATSAVRAAFARPLRVFVDGKQVELHPTKLATAYLKAAVARARSAHAGVNIKLTVSVHGKAVRSAVAHVAKRFAQRARSAQLSFRHDVPQLEPEVDGRTLDESALVARVVRSLASNVRLPLHVKTRTVEPSVTASKLGPAILINRETNRLSLFNANGLWRSFPVATGQSVYPTPTGRFSIVVKQLNPWWYPPTYDEWAKGLSPVPPGPGNPLGTRWMGLSASGVGIHGTNNPNSIGYSVSHGCIRMQVADSEWLYGHVKIGTTVFIV